MVKVLMKDTANLSRKITLSVVIILTVLALLPVISGKRAVVNDYLTLTVTCRESSQYGYAQNGVNLRPIGNPFQGR